MPTQHASDQHERIFVDRLRDQHDLTQFRPPVALDDLAQHVLAYPNGLGHLDLLPVGIPYGCGDNGADCFTPALKHFPLAYPSILIRDCGQ
jgi:hypothetical protein